MITDLNPYPAMKDSGIPWLAEVPEHWEVLAWKRLGWFRSGAGFPIGEQGQRNLELPFFKVSDMNLSGNNSVMTIWNNSVSRNTAARLGASIFPSGTILFPKVGGALLTNKRRVVERPCCIDNNMMGCVVRRGNSNFVLLLLKHLDLAMIAKPGPVPAISEGEVREVRTVFPPISEQTAIVRYLDHADRRIQRYIRAKQKLIALLEEERKKATIESLQSVSATRHRLETVAELVARPVDRVNEQKYTPIGLYNRGRGIFKKPTRNGSELGDSDFFWIEEGDLIISGQFAWEGAIALAGAAEVGCVASHRYPILRGKSQILESGFLLAFLQTDWGQLLLDHHSRGAAGRNRPLNARTLMKEKISLPTLQSQRVIVTMLECENELRRQTKELTERLREYRTRLIADVVTGKLDVREAAAKLPEVDPLAAEDDPNGFDHETGPEGTG